MNDDLSIALRRLLKSLYRDACRLVAELNKATITKERVRAWQIRSNRRQVLLNVFTLSLLLVRLGLAESAAIRKVRSQLDVPQGSVSPLWGGLTPGSYHVGFRMIFRFDASRTWHVTRDYKGAYTPDLHGRPVQLNVWYPADLDARGKEMKFNNYVEQVAPEEFTTFNALMKERNRQGAESSVPSEQLGELLSTRVHALLETSPAQGRFPTVLYVGGLNADIDSNFILAEFLASHGYVVASVSLLGRTDQVPSLGRSPADIEIVVRDLEFALAVLGESANVDLTKLGVVGHSMGAVDAAVLGLRHGNLLAVVGLDGTYGFKGSTDVLTNAYGYSPECMRAAFLDLRRAEREPRVDLDLGSVRSFRYADRNLVGLRSMHHSDFTSFAMIASKFDVPIKTNYLNTGWDRGTGRRGFEDMCGIVLGFLDEKLKVDTGGVGRFREAVHLSKGSTFSHFAAVCAPPSPREAVDLADQRGIDALKSIFTNSSGELPVGSCVDSGLFNTYGYELLGKHRIKEALFIFEIVAWAHPSSANAQDSLADALFAVGEEKRARAAIERAIELVPSDPTINAEAKSTFIGEEQRRLGQLK